jgi:ribonuclease BN (tRNA processing enzyme)
MDLTVLGGATPYPRPGAPCSGYLVRHGGTRLWMDAGTGTLAALQEHVRPDLLLCEADGDAPADGGPRVHLTPEDAGGYARRAGARRLAVTHVGPFLRPADAVRRAGAVFGGPVEYARPGAVFRAGDPG